jgi:hypothetical protein
MPLPSYCATFNRETIMAHSNPYLKYYHAQVGGTVELPMFVGGQHGAGIGDFFRSVLRFIAPIALRGLSTFATSTMRAHEGGASLKDAARGAVAPSLGAMASAVSGSLNNQSGSGSNVNALFDGDEGVPFANAPVFKRALLKQLSHHTHHPSSSKTKRSSRKHKLNKPDYEYNF